MIVRYNDEEYMVIYLYFVERKGKAKYHACYWNLRKSFIDNIDFFDAEIIDGRLPPNMCIKRSIETDSKECITMVSLTIEHSTIFRESHWFWEAFDNDEPKANLLFYQIINEMKEFHGLPIDDLSELEEEVRREEMATKPLTEEERRAKALNDELEEYLRIGEEIENSAR